MADKLILLDTLGILYRGHYAMIKRHLKGRDGTVTSGISHLLDTLTTLISENPESLVVAVGDAPAKTFRSDLFPEYKANRPPTPEDLKVQTELAREIIPLLGIPFIEKAGLEADDIIAGFAGSSDIPVLVVSPDKDLLQLVSGNVTVLRPGSYGGKARLVKSDDVVDITGVLPEQVADYLALMGDSSDNIPGARGIGAKGAAKLMNSYGSINDIYKHIDSVEPASVKKKLIDSREMVMLSLELTRLNRPLPDDLRALNLKMTEPDRDSLFPILDRLSLSRVAETAGISLKGGISGGESEPYRCSFRIIQNPSDMMFCGSGPVSIDTETTSKNPSEAELIGFSITVSEEQGWYFNCRDNQQNLDEALQILEKEAASRGFVAQNAKYDARVLSKYGVELPPPSGDPYLADYLLRPDAREHSLKRLVPLWLGKTMDTFDEVSEGTGSLIDTPVERIAQYCCTDSASTLALSRTLDSELEKDPPLRDVYRTIELPLSAVLCQMENRGVGLDREALRKEGDEISREIFTLMELAAKQCGRTINLASPAQVASVMFDTLGLTPVRKTSKGARSTGMTVLNALKDKHPFVNTLIEFRELSKLQNTYVQKLPEYVDQGTGLIHTSFNQAVAATGRLSSSNPNMQNIPIRTRRGKEIRRCFVPPVKGDLFVTADYSQIELRVLAHLAGDGVLRKAYREETDIHSRTAEAVFGGSDQEQRRIAKEVNFSIIYGISPYGLSQRLSISRGEAAGIISRYYDTYPEVREFYEDTVRKAEKTGEIRTIFGRKRLIAGLADAKGNQRKQLERIAVNSTVQGSAADIIKLAMIRVSDRLKKELPEAGLVLQVHDELVLTCSEKQREKAVAILSDSMQDVADLQVPLTVETGWGANWLSAGH